MEPKFTFRVFTERGKQYSVLREPGQGSVWTWQWCPRLNEILTLLLFKVSRVWFSSEALCNSLGFNWEASAVMSISAKQAWARREPQREMNTPLSNFLSPFLFLPISLPLCLCHSLLFLSLLSPPPPPRGPKFNYRQQTVGSREAYVGAGRNAAMKKFKGNASQEWHHCICTCTAQSS